MEAFISSNIGLVVEIGTLTLLYLGYRSDRNKEQKRQNEMHAKNTSKLDNLTDFADEQRELNSKRDEQISLLKEQTSVIIEMNRGFNRRLEMMEDRK